MNTGVGTSIKFIRNDSRVLSYLESAYQAEEFLERHNYGSLAGPCVIRDYRVFIDSNCTVAAESVDEEIDAAIDVANTVATHAVGQCGVVGHLFPFPAPFGNIECTSSYFTATNYDDW